MIKPTPEKRTGSLTLTRHVGQSIYVGDNLRITVVGSRARAVRFSIETTDRVTFGETTESVPRRSRAGDFRLWRSVNQKLVIDGGFASGGVTIVLVSVKGSYCRVQIQAPRSVPIRRNEDQRKAAS